MMRVAIITDGEQRAALATVRSLGSSGWRVLVCSSFRRCLAGASRYAAREFTVPSALDEPAAFARAIASLSATEGAELILPISEPGMLAILTDADRLVLARVPFPDLERFRRISNKRLLLDIARSSGIAVPAQSILGTAEQVDDIAEDLRFPVVLKPSRSVVETDGGRKKTTVRFAADLATLREHVRRTSAAAFPLLIQQRIVGPGIGIFLLRWEGQIMAQFAHRRLREKPPAGGVSVYRESIAADPALASKSASLLAFFEWHGPAMIEYKLDAATDTPYLMEINGRFWGSLQLAIDAGVDFPMLLARLSQGERFEPVLTYRLGVRSRWWWGDVDHLLARLRRSHDELALAEDSPTRLEAVRNFLTLYRPGDRNEIFRLRDPFPALRETLSWVRGE